MFFEMRFDLGTLDSAERLLPFGLLVYHNHFVDCEQYVWIAGGSYDCSNLLDPSNKYGIYEKRHRFCNNGMADCCVTCAKVREVGK